MSPKSVGGYYETTTPTNKAASEPSPQSMMLAHAEVASQTDSTKAETPAMDAAMQKYNTKDYAGAANNFEEVLKQNPNGEKALFYSAVSYLSLGQTEKTVAHLNKVMQNQNSEYYDAAQWYLSLAYIKNNDVKNARANLLQIQNNSRSKYQKQADETLKEMNK